MRIFGIVLAVLLAAGIVLAGDAATAQPSDPDAYADPPPRKRPRVQVRPRYGSQLPPNAVRQCRAWLAQEFRPSGTVIVPRQQCWWE